MGKPDPSAGGASFCAAKLGVAALILTTMWGSASCYKPDFTTAIYVCDVYTCPQGQVCNSDQVCVQFPIEGCINGGFAASGDISLCPGASNRCRPEFSVCTAPPAGLACSPTEAPADLSGVPPCLLCCRN